MTSNAGARKEFEDANMGDRDLSYLDSSREWPFRLFTRAEVCKILRISVQTFYRLRKAGYLKPLVRRDGKRTPNQRGLTFYSDMEVFKAIFYLFPGIADDEVAAMARALGKKQR